MLKIISNFDDEDESTLLKLHTYFNATFSTAKIRKGFGTTLDQPVGSPSLSVNYIPYLAADSDNSHYDQDQSVLVQIEDSGDEESESNCKQHLSTH